MTFYVDPPVETWRPPRPTDVVRQAVADAGVTLCESSDQSGGAVRPIIATGHQTFLWHPGILAKYMAADALATSTGGTAWHVVVDQDVHDASTLELPTVRDGRLEVHRLKLGRDQPNLSLGFQPPFDAAAMRDVIQAAAESSSTSRRRSRGRDGRDGLDGFDGFDGTLAPPASLDALVACAAELASQRFDSLADQMVGWLAVLMRPWVQFDTAKQAIRASRLLRTMPGRRLLDAMRDDPRGCVHAYNQAVAGNPQGGVKPLHEQHDRVELPLWWMATGQPRRRVYADIVGGRAELADNLGRVIDVDTMTDHACLAPRALTLTAIIRGGLCDLFIHGRGGGLYDLAAEAWMSRWLDLTLAPMVVVSADVRLPFDAPVASETDYRDAVWRAHHLPHNVDRALGLNSPEATRKQRLLATMNDDRDRGRRRVAFDEIHKVNANLVATYPDVIAEAIRDREIAKCGLANHAIARRRDWCFAIYPDLKPLRLEVEQAMSAWRQV